MNKEDKEDKEDEKENDEKKPEFTKENPSTIRKSGKIYIFKFYLFVFFYELFILCLRFISFDANPGKNITFLQNLLTFLRNKNFLKYFSFFLIYIIKQDICIYVAYSRPNG